MNRDQFTTHQNQDNNTLTGHHHHCKQSIYSTLNRVYPTTVSGRLLESSDSRNISIPHSPIPLNIYNKPSQPLLTQMSTILDIISRPCWWSRLCYSVASGSRQ